ncbi:MAG: ATP-binding cassette domain-containing protein, partial [Rhodoluna sp.]
MSNATKKTATEARAELKTVKQTPGASKPDAILVVDNVVRDFGGNRAVDVDHLEVQRGVITALIGPNGAGKTTFFNLITGFDQPSSAKKMFGGPSADKAAKWSFNGKLLGNTAAASVAKSGMVRTFQLTKALSRLTVMQNMLLGAKDQRGESFLAAFVKPLWAAQEKANIAKAEDLLKRFKLYEKKEDLAGSLSGG